MNNTAESDWGYPTSSSCNPNRTFPTQDPPITMAANSRYKKGIILAGGTGSRLYPATRNVSKQLLTVYDKPMIYYPLSTLMLAGIDEILIISTPQHLGSFEQLLGDGRDLGVALQYAAQPSPDGLPEAYGIGRSFVAKDNVAMILGDNIFCGEGFRQCLGAAAARKTGGTIFVKAVQDAERYGVLELDSEGRPLSLEEKPVKPKSNLAVTGIYFFDNRVLEIAADLKPSARGETEIVDVIRRYLDLGELHVEQLDADCAWLDTGTPKSLSQAAHCIEVAEREQGIKIGCPEQAAFTMGLITAKQLEKLADPLEKGYGDYLRSLLQKM